jgi:hypothetical protein
MSPSAQRAQHDFVRLAAEEPSSLYFEEFLRHGFEEWPSSYRHRFPGLATWRGVGGLKKSLRALAGAPDDWNVLLAGRSLSLVKLAARRMFRVCRNVLTTDLSWPTYQQVIERNARRRVAAVTVVPLRNRVLSQQWTANDVAAYLAAAFGDAGCDGLFLPAVDHLGVRLPIREIVRQIKGRRELWYCFIDAAQAFCQVPIDDCLDVADFIVTGSHKWMGAYLPLGIGFSRPSKLTVRDSRTQTTAEISDPLLNFAEQLDGADISDQSETVNVTPLFTCGATAFDLALTCHRQAAIPTVAEIERRITVPHDWRPRRPHTALCSRIVLFEPRHAALRRQATAAVRRTWLDAGLVVTAYPGGRVRVSLPSELTSSSQGFNHGFATTCGTSAHPVRTQSMD